MSLGSAHFLARSNVTLLIFTSSSGRSARVLTLLMAIAFLLSHLPNTACLSSRCGVAATVVNGEVLLRDGKHTGALPGKLLRGPKARVA